MTGGDDMTPDARRTDELLAGRPPADEAEREILHLAARLRGAQPEVPDAVRDRIADLGEPPPGTSLVDRLRGLAGGSPLTAAGVVASLIAVIAIGAALLRGPGDAPTPARSGTAVEAAPGASAGAGDTRPPATLSAAPESTGEPVRRAPSAAAPSAAAPSIAAPSAAAPSIAAPSAAAPPPPAATDAGDLPRADAGQMSATVPAPRAGEAVTNAVGRIRAVGGGVTAVRAEPFGAEGVRIEIAGRVPEARLGEVFTGPPAGAVDGAAVRALGGAARAGDLAGIRTRGAAIVAADARRAAGVPEERAATATFVVTVAG